MRTAMGRYLLVSTVIGLLFCCTPRAGAIDRTWDHEAANDLWISATNWGPNGVPEFSDDVYIGDTGSTADDTVLLTSFGGQLTVTVRNLTINRGTDLDTDGNILQVRQDTVVGSNIITGETLSELIIPSAGDGVLALDTNTLTIRDQGRLRMSGSRISVDGTGDVDGVLEVQQGGSIFGYGVINLDDDNISDFTLHLRNEGTITVGDPDAFVIGEPPARTLQVNVPSDPRDCTDGGCIDLAGLGSDGAVVITRNATFDLNSRPQNFRGLLRLFGNSTLDSSVSFLMYANPGDAASLVVDSGATDGFIMLPAAPAVITGAPFTIGLNSGIYLNEGDEVLVFESRFESGTSGTVGTISNAGTIHFAGDAQIVTGTIFDTISGGRLVNGPGSTLTLDDGVDADTPLTNDGLLEIDETAAGEARVDAFTQTSSTGTLHVQIGDILPGDFDVLTVEGNATLGGTIAVDLIDGFEPVLGNSFIVLETVFGNISGQFDITNVPVFNDLTFDVLYSPQSVVLQVVAAGLPGDYNNDGKVDAADYVVWRKTDGTPEGYNKWRANFGQTAGSGALSNATVPEPASASLLMLAGLVLFTRPRFTSRVPSTQLRVE